MGEIINRDHRFAVFLSSHTGAYLLICVYTYQLHKDTQICVLQTSEERVKSTICSGLLLYIRCVFGTGYY